LWASWFFCISGRLFFRSYSSYIAKARRVCEGTFRAQGLWELPSVRGLGHIPVFNISILSYLFIMSTPLSNILSAFVVSVNPLAG